jgi:purine-binding chemotaxis protein CheW
MSIQESHIATEALIFGLNGERFALPAGMVQEILDPVPVTVVPNAKRFVDGLINVRGKIVPLADLRLRFGMPLSEDTVDTRFIVIEAVLFGEPTLVGIRADKVHEVTEIKPTAIEDVPAVGLKWRPEFVQGIGKDGGGFIVLPNIENLFEIN